MEQGNIYSLMQTGKPFKSYIKTILGKLYVTIWDSFTNKPIGLIIQGNPKGSDNESCIVDVWSEQENVFLKRTNRRHFETGYLIEYTRIEKEKEKSPNDVTDEELNVLINSKFLTLQSAVNKMTSVAPIFRLLEMAKEQEKSDKIIKFLEGKLSEIQLKEYKTEEE